MVSKYLLHPLLFSITASFEYSFRNACDLHDSQSKLGYYTPKQMLPVLANNDWLFTSHDGIKKYYDKGKRECKEYLATTKFDDDIPKPKAK